jgi:hypothetical protein
VDPDAPAIAGMIQVLRGVRVTPLAAAAEMLLACLVSSWLDGRVLSSDSTCVC